MTRPHSKTARERKDRMGAALPLLKAAYPDVECSLDFNTPLELLVATILAAQCTDERVNEVTAGLFKKYPAAADYAAATQEQMEQELRSVTMFRNKAKALRSMAADLVAKHGGQVPRTMHELTALAGAGRKTANVVLGNAFNLNVGVTVDTHVTRLAGRLGLSDSDKPLQIEQDLMPLIPQLEWCVFTHLMIYHGRAICTARKPKCPRCTLRPHCPSAEKFIQSGEAG